jgi:molybdate transport system permease protein
MNHSPFAYLPRSRPVTGWSGRLFAAGLMTFVVIFVGGWIALIGADLSYTNWDSFVEALRSKEIGAACWLSIWTSVTTAILGIIFAVPIGYALSRYRFPGHILVDSIVDLPIILPPLIIGLSLLVFFQTGFGRWLESIGLNFVFERRGIVLCQFLASASFGIRALKLAFDGIDPRIEQVAMTLGCSPTGAFFRVALPMARRGIVVGTILIWTRAFGIFGPLMVFVGAVRMRTEVLPTSIYLEQSIGRIEAALAVGILMMALAVAGLVLIRVVGLGPTEGRGRA